LGRRVGARREPSVMGVVRVLVAVGDARTRRALHGALEADGRFSVVADSDHAAAAVAAAVEHGPDLCLIDVELRGHGIAAAWEIAARLPQARIVMLASSTNERDLVAALSAGAVGYLPKDMDSLRLTNALWDVKQGNVAVPRALMTLVVEPVARSERAFVPGSGHKRPVSADRAASGRSSACSTRTCRRARSQSASR
jgi:DNA-binding NarL/FixJ family response regulator